MLFIFSNSGFASSIASCGQYEFKGVLKKDPLNMEEFNYIILESTKSQLSFKIKSRNDLISLIPFLDRPTSFNGEIQNSMNGTRGEIMNISKIDFRFPDPLNQKDQGVTLIKTMDCKKN